MLPSDGERNPVSYWALLRSLPGYLRRFTVAHYLQALVPHAMPQDDTMAAIQSLFSEPPTAASSLLSLALIAVVALWMAARTVSRREYVLDQ